MSSTVAIGVEGVIEIDGAIQVLANVAARGEVSFVLLPGQLYSVHLHDANGRLLGIMRLEIPGGGEHAGDAEDGGEDSSPYGSGQVARPQTRRRAREVLRPRRSRPMRCAFRRRGTSHSGSRDEQTVRDDDELPANMAIRSRDRSPRPRDRSPRVRDRSPRRRPSSSSDVDVVGE